MSYTDDLAPGTAMLGRAVGHAAFLYDEPTSGYVDILSTALGHPGRHAAPDTIRTIHSEYVTGRARDLIASAESGGLCGDVFAMAGWIGAATAVLRELTRDA